MDSKETKVDDTAHRVDAAFERACRDVLIDELDAAIGAINAGHYERATEILREARPLCPHVGGRVTVPSEVLDFFEFASTVFVPFTSQQEELMVSLRKARMAMGRPAHRFGEPPLPSDPPETDGEKEMTELLPYCGCPGPWCEGRDRNNRSRRCLGYQIDPDGGAKAP